MMVWYLERRHEVGPLDLEQPRQHRHQVHDICVRQHKCEALGQLGQNEPASG